MQGPHHRKIELQSAADLSYLYANTVALCRQKLDLHFPLSATNDPQRPDPMKERVKELVDEFITQTFTSAVSSISINGLDPFSEAHPSKSKRSTTSSPLLSSSFFSTREAIEYEPYDSALASRLTSLYAQLESLTTTVAQMRRDAPAKAAQDYADALLAVLRGDDDNEYNDEEEAIEDLGNADIKKGSGSRSEGHKSPRLELQRHPDWAIHVPLGTVREKERWCDGEIEDVYAETLRTLVRLQGEAGDLEGPGDGDCSKRLSATLGKVERARRAVEVVENT